MRHRGVIRRLVSIALSTAAAGAAVIAQQGPSFRARVDLLTIDARVLDRQGRPVRGLRPEDFRVEVDGQLRPVQVLDYVEFGFGRTASSRPAAPPAFQLPGAEPGGRSILVAFDDLSFWSTQNRPVLSELGPWLEQLDPRDAVAVGTTSGLGPRLEFSTDRSATAALLRLLIGRRDRTGPATVEAVVTIEEARTFAECVVRFRESEDPQSFDLASDLQECSQAAQEIYDRECKGSENGQRCASALILEAGRVRLEVDRAVVQQTGGMTDLVRALARAPAPRVLVLLSRGLPLERTTDLTGLAREATSAGIAVYVLAWAGSPAEADVPTKRGMIGLMPAEASRRDDAFSQAGLETIAGVTNGRSEVIVGSAGRFLDRILTEVSGYYRLGVEPSAGARDWMALKITTRRGGSIVHAPSRVGRPGADPEPTKRVPLEERLAAIVRGGGLFRGLGIELATLLGRDARGEQLQVTASVRLREPRTGPIQALFILLAQDGRIVSHGQFALTPRRHAPGFHAAIHVPVVPGRYLLRIGAGDATGEVGLAEQEVIARLPRVGSYFASDLIVAWAGQDGRLQYPEIDEVPPGAVTIRPLLELYATEGRPTVVPKVRLELQPAVGGSGLTRELDVTVGGTMARARAEIPVGSLLPGEYTLRAVVIEGEREAGAVTSRLRIARPAQGP